VARIILQPPDYEYILAEPSGLALNGQFMAHFAQLNLQIRGADGESPQLVRAGLEK